MAATFGEESQARRTSRALFWSRRIVEVAQRGVAGMGMESIQGWMEGEDTAAILASTPLNRTGVILNEAKGDSGGKGRYGSCVVGSNWSAERAEMAVRRDTSRIATVPETRLPLGDIGGEGQWEKGARWAVAARVEGAQGMSQSARTLSRCRALRPRK